MEADQDNAATPTKGGFPAWQESCPGCGTFHLMSQIDYDEGRGAFCEKCASMTEEVA